MNDYLAVPKTALTHKDGYTLHISGYFTLEESANFYILIKDSLYYSHFEQLEGQVNRNTDFGDLLYKIALISNFTRWLEIGTWNGKGTTTCILDGFRDSNKKDAKLISYEANKYMFENAKRNLQTHPNFNSVIFNEGRIDNSKPFPTVDDLSETTRESTYFKQYYDSEKQLYEKAKPIRPEFSPEVCVLDGAEYTGWLDFESIPKDQLKIIFLDDVNCDKNKSVVEHLMKDSLWKLYKKSDSRNGWACFLRNDLVVG
jgi:hypothetical protein